MLEKRRRANQTRVRNTSGGVVTQYLWDGDDLLMELDASGNPVREYTYYPGVDQPHSLRYQGNTYYYALEQPGHVMGLINSARQVVNHYEYEPFGLPRRATEQVPQPLRFGARELESETGLYSFRNRWYDPDLGRFLSEDPIGLEGGINLYAFAGNNPLNYTDPYGLKCGWSSGGDIYSSKGLVIMFCPPEAPDVAGGQIGRPAMRGPTIGPRGPSAETLPSAWRRSGPLIASRRSPA